MRLEYTQTLTVGNAHPTAILYLTDIQTKYNLTDLAKPQAVEVLQARIAKYSLMSDAESAAKASAWERFKQDIDAERPDDCKLYS